MNARPTKVGGEPRLASVGARRVATLTSEPGDRSHPKGRVSPPKTGCSRGDRNKRPRSKEGGRRPTIAKAIEGQPKTASARAAFVSGAKATAPVLLALIPFALAFGATAAGGGLSTLETVAMSVFVFAGAAQLAMVPLISAGASVAVIVLTVMIINLRMTLYSAS